MREVCKQQCFFCLDDIIVEYVPFAPFVGPHFILMQDYLNAINTSLMEYPPNSPDLNPIYQLWNYINNSGLMSQASTC